MFLRVLCASVVKKSSFTSPHKKHISVYILFSIFAACYYQEENYDRNQHHRF